MGTIISFEGYFAIYNQIAINANAILMICLILILGVIA